MITQTGLQSVQNAVQQNRSAEAPPLAKTEGAKPESAVAFASAGKAQAVYAYKAPQPAGQAEKARPDDKLMDMLRALQTLRRMSGDKSEAPVLYGSERGAGAKLGMSVWSDGQPVSMQSSASFTESRYGDDISRTAQVSAKASFAGGDSISASLTQLSDGRGNAVAFANVTLSARAEIASISTNAFQLNASAGGGDDVLSVSTANMAFVDGGLGNDVLSVSAGFAKVTGGAGDDEIAVASGMATGIRGGAGADKISVAGQYAGAVSGGAGADRISVSSRDVDGVSGGDGADLIGVTGFAVKGVSGGAGADIMHVVQRSETDAPGGASAGRVEKFSFSDDGEPVLRMHAVTLGLNDIDGGAGDDVMVLEGETIRNVTGGAGRDSIQVIGGSAEHVSGGAGDDIIAMKTETGSLDFAAGDGKDIVSLGEGGAFAINISDDLAASAEDVSVEDLGGGAMRLSFGGEEQITLFGVDKAAGLKIGGEGWSLDLKEAAAPRAA